jgi:hypothetical protein
MPAAPQASPQSSSRAVPMGGQSVTGSQVGAHVDQIEQVGGDVEIDR